MKTARQLLNSACDEARSPSFENPKIRLEFQP